MTQLINFSVQEFLDSPNIVIHLKKKKKKKKKLKILKPKMVNVRFKIRKYSISKDKIIITVKILKIGTPKIITVIVLQLEQLDFTVQ